MQTSGEAPSAAQVRHARKRPRRVRPVLELAPARRVAAHADWPGYLAALVRRGRLSVLFDPRQAVRCHGTARADVRTRPR